MSILRDAINKMMGQGKTLDPKAGNLPKIDSPSSQTVQEKDIIEYIKRKVTEVRQNGSRISQESIWMTNYAYLMGFDSIYFDSTTRQFKDVGRSTNGLRRDRMKVNKILPTTQRRQARLCKNLPRFEVRPDDATQEAKERARLEQQLSEYYFEKERVQEKRLVMMTGLQQCGHYYMHPYWDTEAGDILEAPKDDPTAEMQAGSVAAGDVEKAALSDEEGVSGATDPVSDYEYEGDLKIELVSPFEIFADPLATCMEDARWVIRAKVRKLEYFKTKYPERGPLVREEGAWLLSIQNELRINTMTGQGPATTGAQTQMHDAAIEFTLYERPTKKHPKGRMIIMASDVLLKDTHLDIGTIPFVKFDDMPIAGKYYPEAIITHLRPIQDQYNRLVTMRAEWANRMLVGKWLLHASAQIPQEALNDQSGEKLYHNTMPGASEPKQMQVPVIPQYAYEEEDKLNQMFYDIAGEGEISRGILPAAGIPAIGMQLLLEQDETRIAVQTEQHEHAFGQLMGMSLKYLEKFVTNERLLKIADANSQYTIKTWTGSDLTTKHDVICRRGSLAPASKASKRNDIINLYNMSLLGEPTDPQVRSKVLTALENGDVNTVWADQALDMGQIKRSIEMIEQGVRPEVFEGDNHIMHWQEKNKYRKSDKFQELDPEGQALLILNMEEHLKFLQKITAPQFGMPPNAQDEFSQSMDVNMLQEQADTAGAQLESQAQNQRAQMAEGASEPPAQ